MRLRQLVVVGTVVCGLVGAAAAEGDASWDGRYEHTSGGGNEKCPDAVTVVASGGTFSFPWNVRLADRVYRVGTIAGSVRPSGFAVFKATLVDPLPRETQAALEDAGDTVEMLQTLASEMELVFRADKCVSGDSTNKALGNGMACDYDSECASDHCFFNKCSSGDDNKKDLGAGADCDFPSDGASGECNFHKCE